MLRNGTLPSVPYRFDKVVHIGKYPQTLSLVYSKNCFQTEIVRVIVLLVVLEPPESVNLSLQAYFTLKS